MDKNEIKEKLSKEDITKIVMSMGSAEPKTDMNGDLIFQSVCHGSTSYKMYYFVDSKNFHCYTQCHDNFDIYELVSRVHSNPSFIENVRYVADFFGFEFSSQRPKGFLREIKYTDDWDMIDRYNRIYDRINKEEEIIQDKHYNEHLLKLFSELYYCGWIEEGLSVESMQKYGILYRQSESEIIIPYREITGGLIGIRSRTLIKHKVDSGFKYMPTSIQGKFYTHAVSNALYGLNINHEVIRRIHKIMLVEGEKTVIKCHTFYGENNFTAGLSSSSLSEEQRDIILSLGVSEAILAFDKPSEEIWNNEEEKEKYINNILKVAYMLSPYMTVYVLWDDYGLLDFKDSPADKGKEVLEELMKNKQEVESREED